MERIATSLASIIIAKQAYKAAKRLARMRQERKTRRRWFRKKQAIDCYFLLCCCQRRVRIAYLSVQCGSKKGVITGGITF